MIVRIIEEKREKGACLGGGGGGGEVRETRQLLDE